MSKTLLALALIIAMATPALAQVSRNSSTSTIRPGTYTTKPNGGYTYRSNGYSFGSDGKGNTTSSAPGGYKTYNGVTQQPQQKYKY